MKSNYTEKAKAALMLAQKEARKFNQSYIGTEHILIGLLKENTALASKVLQDNGVDYQKVKELMEDLIAPDFKVAVKEKDGYSPKAQAVLEEAAVQAERFGYEKIGTEHILLALIKDTDNVAVRLLNTMGISTQRVYIDILIAMGEDGNLYKVDLAKNKGKQKTILEQYSRDLTHLAQIGKIDPVIGREDEIKRVIQILSRRTKNNPCLLGEPGVGKTAIVEGLAEKIVKGEVPESVKGKRVLSVDLSAILAGTKYRGEFEDRLRKILTEIDERGNVILFIDEIHTIIGAGDAEGGVDASNILKPAMARGEIQLIGATTLTEYRKYVERDAALERRLQPVHVEEPTKEETLEILKGIISRYEAHHNVKISEAAIRAAVELSVRYIHDRNLPDKAIDVLDEAAASIKLYSAKETAKLDRMYEEIKEKEQRFEEALIENEIEKASEINKELQKIRKKYEKAKKAYLDGTVCSAVVTESDIEKIVSVWTKIPVTKLAEKESEKLLKLETILHQRVIGQEEAVVAVAKAVRRGRVGLKDPNRPIGSFLFLGPTGVGKTELSKALAQAMFDSENSIIRVDMSEYMEGHSVSKMIGSPPGYVGFDEGGQLSEKVRKNPYSVVLFDEIEKAHPDVFNILLQVLDDGHITDAKGRKVSFKNTILIMTSNVGAKRIMEPKNLGFRTEQNEEKDYEKMKQNVMEEVKRTFKPEFINRIDEIMVFHTLNHQNMLDIVGLLTDVLTKRCEEQLDIKLVFTEPVKEYLVKKYADAKMGARPLKRGIQTAVEDLLAQQILEGKVERGDEVTVSVKDEKIIFSVKNA